MTPLERGIENSRIKALEDALRIGVNQYCETRSVNRAFYDAAVSALAASQPAPDWHQPDLVTVQDAARVPEIAAMIEALDRHSIWLSVALTCPAWVWDADQRELAKQHLAEGIDALLAIAEGRA